MSDENSQTVGGSPEAATPQEEESHLSDTARFVLPFLRKITKRLRDNKLIARGNEIIRLLMEGKITEKDPMVIDFILDCGEEKDVIIKELIAEKAGSKAESVIRNYFSKFLEKEIRNKEKQPSK